MALGSTAVLFAATTPADRTVKYENEVRPEEGFWIGPVVFSPSMLMSYTYNSNIFGVEDGSIDPTGCPNANDPNTCKILHSQGDSVSVARAKLAFKVPFSHSYASLSWLPLYREYGTAKAPLNLAQQLVLESRLNFSNGKSILLKDELFNGFFDVRTSTQSQGLEFSSTPYRKNHQQIGLDWPFASEWGLAGKLERTDFIFDRTQAIDLATQSSGSNGEERGLIEFFDYVTDSLETSAYRNFSRYRIYTTLEAARTNQDRRKFNESQFEATGCKAHPTTPECVKQADEQIDFERIDQADVSVGIKGRLFRNTEGTLEAGYTTWNFQKGQTRGFSGVSLYGKIDHAFNPMTVGYLRIESTPEQATGQVTGYYLSSRLTAGIDRKLTMNLTARAGVGFDNTVFPDPNGFKYAGYSGDFQVRYRPGQSTRPGPFVLTVFYRPEFRNSGREGFNQDSQRAGISFEYGWF